MPASSLSVAPIATAQVLAGGKLLAEAFDDDPAYRFLFPSPVTRRRGLADFFARNLRTHLAYRCSYVLTDHDDVVATVTIRPPGGVRISLATMLRRGLVPFAVNNGLHAVNRLLLLKRTYDQLEEQVADGGPHRLVHMMAVAPPHQGRGLGTSLLHEAIALSADAHGAASLPILLTTHTERNVTFYGKSAFEVADRRVLALGAVSYQVWSMRRSPPSAQP